LKPASKLSLATLVFRLARGCEQAQSVFVRRQNGRDSHRREALAMPGFDGNSVFNLSVSTIVIGAAMVIGFYAVQAMI
jgi:hypothetical protein